MYNVKFVEDFGNNLKALILLPACNVYSCMRVLKGVFKLFEVFSLLVYICKLITIIVKPVYAIEAVKE